MTDPKLAVATDLGRFYVDPRDGRQLISVTNVIGRAVAKPALVPWGAGAVADYVIANPISVARRARSEKTALRKELVRQPEVLREKASNLGTRIHHRAAAMVLGEPYAEDPEVDPYARELLRFWRLWNVDIEEDIEAVEISVFNRRHGYAGTADVFMWLRTGRWGRKQRWLIDYKSSAKRPATSAYAEQAFQLAALRYAEGLWLPDDTDGDLPKAQRTGVLNLRPKSHALLDMPGNRRAFRAFLGALRTATWLNDAPSSFPVLLAPGVEQAMTKTRKAA
jgi:hypothetical protein